MKALVIPRVEMLPMQFDDLDAVVAIENEVYPFPWTHGNFVDALKAGYSGWVCRCSDELVGYAVIMLAFDEAHLLNISVGSVHQRLGFGARLLMHAMATARSGGGTSMLLEVRPSNERAIELYRQFGFEEIGRRRGYYPAVNGREDALVLRRPLAEEVA